MPTIVDQVWKQVEETGQWRQDPGQCSELEVQRVADESHLWYDEDAKLVSEPHLTVRLKPGEIAGRDKRDDLVLIRDRNELSQYLEANLDIEPDDTYLPEDRQ